ncbi:MAG: hypothetical protein QM773_12550 [Hyphomonadaceae bacterium]
MLTPSECLLKANNYEMAAKMAAPEDRMMYLLHASHWRQLAHELQMERFGPCGSANLLPGEARPKNRGPEPGMAD